MFLGEEQRTKFSKRSFPVSSVDMTMPMPGCSTRFCFEIRTAKRVYNLGVDSEEQMDKWLRALQRAISGHRSRLSVQPGSREEVVPASLRTAVESPLGRAVWQGDTKEVDEIINRESQLLNSKLDSSNTPLHLAVLRGNNTIIEKLLLRYADFACTFELINFQWSGSSCCKRFGTKCITFGHWKTSQAC